MTRRKASITARRSLEKKSHGKEEESTLTDRTTEAGIDRDILKECSAGFGVAFFVDGAEAPSVVDKTDHTTAERALTLRRRSVGNASGGGSKQVTGVP